MFVPTSDSPTLIYPALPPTVIDNFNDGNDTSPAWADYDPLGGAGIGATPASFITTGGVYILLPRSRQYPTTGQPEPAASWRVWNTRTSTSQRTWLDFDDTVHQVFGIAARIITPGIGHDRRVPLQLGARQRHFARD